MKRVLILAYDFPPYVSVGGLRPHSWYKYLTEYGVYPIVITRQWANKHGNYLDYISPGQSDKTIIEEQPSRKIIRAPYAANLANRLMLTYGDKRFKWLRKIISGFYEYAQFLVTIGPKSTLFKEADNFLDGNKVDVIIATGDPFILFNYAAKLSKKYNTPWIADYRDPWSHKSAIWNNYFLKSWNLYFEKKSVKTASKITTPNPYFKSLLENLHKVNVIELPNGFDPEAIEKTTGINQKSETLQIAYVGYIYDWHPIHSFLSAISEFVKTTPKARLSVNFFGINIPEKILEIAEKELPNLKNHVQVHPKLPNEELLKRLAEHNLLLLFNYYSFPGTKIYDYIGLNRAILFCYANDDQANELKRRYFPYPVFSEESETFQQKIINETSSGFVINNKQDLMKKLTELYNAFLQNGSVQSSTINPGKYSRKKQVEELSEIIKSISKNK